MQKQQQRTRMLILTTLHLVLASMMIALNVPLANADLTDYGLFKGVNYQQSGNTQPSAIIGALGIVSLDDDNGADFASAHVATTSPSSPFPLSVQLSGNSFGIGLGNTNLSKAYGTQTALDTDLPNSALYQFAVSGGTLGTKTASLTSPATDLFPSVPFFNGSIFSQLQGMHSAAPFQFAWNGFTPAAGTDSNSGQIIIDIHRVSDGKDMLSGFLPFGDNTFKSFLLPANTLQPNTTYDASLVYANGILTPNAGFGGAFSQIDFATKTDLIFTTVPEPSSLMLLAVGSLGLFAYIRRRRRV